MEHNGMMWILYANFAQPRGENEQEDGPLEERVVHDVVHNAPEEVPLCTQPRALHTAATPEATWFVRRFRSDLTGSLSKVKNKLGAA